MEAWSKSGSLEDILFNMSNQHISKHVKTIHEELEETWVRIRLR